MTQGVAPRCATSDAGGRALRRGAAADLVAGVAPAPAADVAGLGPPNATPSGPVGPVDWVHPVNVLTGQAQSLTCGPRRKNIKKEKKKKMFYQ